MAHKEQQKWCREIKKLFPQYFVNKRILDVGSLDVNGNNRGLFENCEYIGLDVIPGKNVDVVSIAHQYNPKELFDVVLSTNALEHDIYFKWTLKKMVAVLKPSGLMFFSAAHKWEEHGTKRTSPWSSGTSKMYEAWQNYYRNLNVSDIKKVLNIDDMFQMGRIQTAGRDLRFWGLKK